MSSPGPIDTANLDAATPTSLDDIPDWKVMFYFASDNPLSPLIVSQLKAIKDAGFQKQTEVLVYFDPMEAGVPTKLYNVNRVRRAEAEESHIGDGEDPFVRNMFEDEILESEIPKEIGGVLATSREEAVAFDTLSKFVEYGLTVRPAKNYILILSGHGMIIGNDAFLPDDDPISGIKMEELQQITAKFGNKDETSLRLLALHSCSMSSIELAYQLKGTAEYLIATQGTAFVNSWPYRQLMKKTLKMIDGAIGRGRTVNVQALVEKLYYLTLFNATDFMAAGYSADLALINLKTKEVEKVKKVLANLIKKLKTSLDDETTKDLILLAHLESQSFFEENYTDLFDFCLCLKNRCEQLLKIIKTLASGNSPEHTADVTPELVQNLESLVAASLEVMTVLAVVDSDDRSERFKALVVHEDNFGWKYQFSFGLSIYFPWSEPLDDQKSKPTVPKETESSPPTEGDRGVPPTVKKRAQVLKTYENYDFTKDFVKEFNGDSWLSFLEKYFDETKRKSLSVRATDAERTILLPKAVAAFNSFGVLSDKPTPEVGTRTPEEGVSCGCTSIKNYPTDMRRNVKKPHFTRAALLAFKSAKEMDPIAGDD